LETLKAINEYVDSPRKQSLEEPTVRRIYARLGQEYQPEQSAPISGWVFRDTGEPARPLSGTIAPPSIRPGIPPRGLGPFPAPAQRTRRPSPRPNQQPARFEPKDRSTGLGDPRQDAAPTWEIAYWELCGFSEAERDGWIDAGLRPGQAKLAAELRPDIHRFSAPELSRSVSVQTWLKRAFAVCSRSSHLPHSGSTPAS